jgi:hypothetical protein
MGPIFFHGIVNVTANNCYCFFINQLHPKEFNRGYFQRDGVTAHTIREKFFFNRIASRDICLVRSLDLAPLDFSIFELLKN